MLKKLVLGIGLFAAASMAVIAGCTDADIASQNLSKAADNFEVNRRIVAINGITDAYLLEVTGLCSLGNNDSSRSVSITCKTGPGQFKKYFVGLSDNVTYVVEQLEPMPANTYRYRVTFKPSVIVPDVDVKLGF